MARKRRECLVTGRSDLFRGCAAADVLAKRAYFAFANSVVFSPGLLFIWVMYVATSHRLHQNVFGFHTLVWFVVRVFRGFVAKPEREGGGSQRLALWLLVFCAVVVSLFVKGTGGPLEQQRLGCARRGKIGSPYLAAGGLCFGSFYGVLHRYSMSTALRPVTPPLQQLWAVAS